MKKNCYAVIMGGGIGSRFWPMSRTNHPKQFIDVLGTGNTLNEQMIKQYTRDVKEKKGEDYV
jgi:mannose-1-phosphate guanylyltransferase